MFLQNDKAQPFWEAKNVLSLWNMSVAVGIVVVETALCLCVVGSSMLMC